MISWGVEVNSIVLIWLLDLDVKTCSNSTKRHQINSQKREIVFYLV